MEPVYDLIRSLNRPKSLFKGKKIALLIRPKRRRYGPLRFLAPNIDQKVYFKIIFYGAEESDAEIEGEERCGRTGRTTSLFRGKFGGLPDYEGGKEPVEPEGYFFHTEFADIGFEPAF